MATLKENQEQLQSENVMLHGWFEVLLALKDQMLVTVPALQVEIRGLSNGMALEKMRQEVSTLQSQLLTTNSHLSQVKEDSSSSEDENDKESASAAHVPLFINMLKSSMFVHPSQLWQSIQTTSPVGSSVGITPTGDTWTLCTGVMPTTEVSSPPASTTTPMPDNATSRASTAA
jgi:hypothetical protein